MAEYMDPDEPAQPIPAAPGAPDGTVEEILEEKVATRNGRRIQLIRVKRSGMSSHGATWERKAPFSLKYEVNRIIKKRMRNGRVEYLVSWKMYTAFFNEWLGMEHLKQCKESIASFEQLNEELESRQQPMSPPSGSEADPTSPENESERASSPVAGPSRVIPTINAPKTNSLTVTRLSLAGSKARRP